MTARATPIATFLLLFGAALIASFGSLHAEAPCTDLKPAPDVTSDQTITQAVVWHCVEVHLKANVRITAGGKLRINESVVWIDPVGAATVTIQAEANGRLELNASALLPFADDRHAGRVLLLPDSSADINHTYFERLETFEVRTSAARINDTLVRDPASIGIHVRTASPRLENTTVEGGLTGIRVEGASTPTLRHVLVDGAVVQAVHVGSGVTALLDDVGLCAGDVGILLEGSATATMRRGEFCADLEQEARLLPSGTLAPKLALEGVPHTPARLVREGASRIDVGWFVEVEVFNATSPDASALTGARVLFRNATSHDLAPVLTDARHVAGPALVPDLAYGPQGTVQHNPWNILASKGSNVGNASFEITSNREGDSRPAVELSLDDDADAPQWADTSRALRSLQTVSGHSSDGRVRLAWDAADDTQDGDEPNRGIAEYQLSVLGPAATAVKAHTTLGAIVEGLPEGSHRFKVRPLDLAGNAGPWSNEIPILVDRTIPRISHQSNRTGGPAAGAFKEAFSITLTATDAGSGVASIQYRVDDETTLHAYEGAIPFTREAEYNLTVEARDRAGNLNRSSFRFVLDREAPVIAGGLSPGLPDGESGWYQKAPQLVITSTDVGHAGVHKLEYRLGTTGAWTAYTKATTLEKEGETLIDLRATDGANNAATTAVLLRLDSKTPEIKANLEGPKVSGDWYGGPVRLWANATDEGSGIGEVAYRLAEGPWSDFQNPLRLAHAGAQRVSVRAKDVAGAASPEKSFVVQIDGDKPVPPVPRWSTDSNGFLHVNWTGAGPADLGSGIARIAVEQMGSDGGALRSFAGSTSAQKASVGPFERGLHQFRVSVTDLAGNSASTPWTAIEILQSAGGLTSASQSIVARDQTVLQFIPPAGFEPLEVVFYVDGQIVSAHGSPPYRFSWDTQTVADGLHSIKVVARSTNGQVMEETASYDVRNEYVHVLEDHAVPFSLSLGACGIVFPASVILRRRWRTL